MVQYGKMKFCFQVAGCHHRQGKWLDRICWSVHDIYFNILVTSFRNVYVFYTKFRKPVQGAGTGIMFFSFAIFLVLLCFYLCSDPFSREKEKKIVNYISHPRGEVFSFFSLLNKILLHLFFHSNNI